MPKKPKDEPPITVRLPDAERKALDAYAQEHDLNRSQVIRRAIKVYLAQSKKGQQ